MEVSQIPEYCGGAVLHGFENNSEKSLINIKEIIDEHLNDCLSDDDFTYHNITDMPKRCGYIFFAYLNQEQLTDGWAKLLIEFGFQLIALIKNPNTHNKCYSYKYVVGKEYSLKKLK